MRFEVFYLTFLILAAYVSTVVGVGLWRRFAVRRRLLDYPNERSSHAEPTPSGGGVVIFFVTVSFLILAVWQNGQLFEILPFLIGASIVAAVSWADDLLDLPSLLRLAVHFAAALTAIFGIEHFRFFDAPAESAFDVYSLIGQFLTVLWIVGLTNAYNFMDGIDGIAGTQGVIAGAGWSLLGFFSNQPIVFLLGALLSAANLGFLWHNWHPARIFMGDVGSAFIGYSLAVMPLLALKNAGGGKWTIIGVLLVWTFVFDTVLTFIRRLLNGENVLAAHRLHLYQRLVIAGYRHNRVALGYGFMAAVGCVLTFLSFDEGESSLAVVATVIFLMCLSLWIVVKKSERRIEKA